MLNLHQKFNHRPASACRAQTREWTLFYVLIPQIFATYLPTSWGPLPTLLFGAGAVLLARNPDGIITMNGRQLAALARRLARGGQPPGESRTHNGGPASAVATELEDVQ